MAAYPEVVIAGIGQVPVREYWDVSLRDLAGRALRAAIKDAGGLKPRSLYIGSMLAASASPQGVSSMAMQQGGLGLLMTLFLITVPPMAAAFFQGTVGQFMAYNAFGQGQAVQPSSSGSGYQPIPNQPPAPPPGTTTVAPHLPNNGYRSIG